MIARLVDNVQAGDGRVPEPVAVRDPRLAAIGRLEHSRRGTIVAAWGATVRGTYGTAVAGTRTPYVQYVAPWGQAALCVRYVPNAGGWYA